MTVKWYEEHLENVVKQNQSLRFQCRKLIDQQRQNITEVNHLFRQLFTDVPHLDITQQHRIDHLLNYYGKIGGKWIEMTQQKLRILTIQYQDSKANSQKNNKKQKAYVSLKEKEKCILCGHHKDRSIYDRLASKISQLESEIQELRNQIDKLQQEQEKYLKQISYLRSITKKMEYQIAQQCLTNSKIDKVYKAQYKEYEAQILKLKNQVEIWKAEYDRLWQEQGSKMRGYQGKDSTFQQERALLNTLYKQEKDLIEPSYSQSSRFWMIQNNSIQPLKTEVKKQEGSTLPTTSRQQLENIK